MKKREDGRHKEWDGKGDKDREKASGKLPNYKTFI